MDRLQFIATSLPSLPPSFLSSSLSKRGKDSNWTHKELDTTERLHFQSVCAPRSEVGLSQMAYVQVLFLYPFSQAMSLVEALNI